MLTDSSPRPIHIVDSALPFDFDRPEQAEVQALEALRIAQEAGDVPRALEVRTQVARAQVLQGKLYDAECTLFAILKQLESVTEPAPKIRYTLEMGRLMTARKTPSEARSRFVGAWELACQHREEFF